MNDKITVENNEYRAWWEKDDPPKKRKTPSKYQQNVLKNDVLQKDEKLQQQQSENDSNNTEMKLPSMDNRIHLPPIKPKILSKKESKKSKSGIGLRNIEKEKQMNKNKLQSTRWKSPCPETKFKNDNHKNYYGIKGNKEDIVTCAYPKKQCNNDGGNFIEVRSPFVTKRVAYLNENQQKYRKQIGDERYAEILKILYCIELDLRNNRREKSSSSSDYNHKKEEMQISSSRFDVFPSHESHTNYVTSKESKRYKCIEKNFMSIRTDEIHHKRNLRHKRSDKKNKKQHRCSCEYITSNSISSSESPNYPKSLAENSFKVDKSKDSSSREFNSPYSFSNYPKSLAGNSFKADKSKDISSSREFNSPYSFSNYPKSLAGNSFKADKSKDSSSREFNSPYSFSNYSENSVFILKDPTSSIENSPSTHSGKLNPLLFKRCSERNENRNSEFKRDMKPKPKTIVVLSENGENYRCLSDDEIMIRRYQNPRPYISVKNKATNTSPRNDGCVHNSLDEMTVKSITSTENKSTRSNKTLDVVHDQLKRLQHCRQNSKAEDEDDFDTYSNKSEVASSCRDRRVNCSCGHAKSKGNSPTRIEIQEDNKMSEEKSLIDNIDASETNPSGVVAKEKLDNFISGTTMSNVLYDIPRAEVEHEENITGNTKHFVKHKVYKPLEHEIKPDVHDLKSVAKEKLASFNLGNEMSHTIYGRSILRERTTNQNQYPDSKQLCYDEKKEGGSSENLQTPYVEVNAKEKLINFNLGSAMTNTLYGERACKKLEKQHQHTDNVKKHQHTDNVATQFTKLFPSISEKECSMPLQLLQAPHSNQITLTDLRNQTDTVNISTFDSNAFQVSLIPNAEYVDRNISSEFPTQNAVICNIPYVCYPMNIEFLNKPRLSSNRCSNIVYVNPFHAKNVLLAGGASKSIEQSYKMSNEEYNFSQSDFIRSEPGMVTGFGNKQLEDSKITSENAIYTDLYRKPPQSPQFGTLHIDEDLQSETKSTENQNTNNRSSSRQSISPELSKKVAHESLYSKDASSITHGGTAKQTAAADSTYTTVSRESYKWNESLYPSATKHGNHSKNFSSNNTKASKEEITQRNIRPRKPMGIYPGLEDLSKNSF